MSEDKQPADNSATTPIEQPISATQLKPDNDPYDLDLDLLQPQPKYVRLDGKRYAVYPPRVKDIANLARLAGQLRVVDENTVEQKVNEMLDAFKRIMPGLKDNEVDLTIEQLTMLFEFVNRMVSPAENSALKSMGIEPTAEKKITAA